MGKRIAIASVLLIGVIGLQAGIFAANQTITDPWADGETPTASKWNSHENTFLSGINNVESVQIVDGTIVSSDISASAAIPYSKLSFSNNIVAGDIAAGAIDAGDMATTGTIADDKAFVADSATAGTWRTINDCPDTGGNHLNYTQSSNSFSCGTTSASVTGITLPPGAVFFMITGSCPASSTDITATYTDRFPRINSTMASTGGADSHAHTGPSHDHAVSGTTNLSGAPDLMGGGGTPQPGNHLHSFTITSGSGGTGSTSSVSNVPAYFTVKLCQVN